MHTMTIPPPTITHPHHGIVNGSESDLVFTQSFTTGVTTFIGVGDGVSISISMVATSPKTSLISDSN